MIRQLFIDLVSRYSGDAGYGTDLWHELETHYTQAHRAYHNFAHLDFLFKQLYEVKDQIKDWQTVLFSVFYHDIVYDTNSGTNEEQSADIAAERLREIGYPADKIKKCHAMILATKGHTITHDNDTDLFTDADLSILGQPHETYMTYAKQIRSEYSQYPDQVYKAGRKKVLEHFLNMPRIYKSDHFFSKFEQQARVNLAHELSTL